MDLKDDPKFKFRHGLKEASNEIESIEASTWEQANDLVLFKHRRYRFTASLCNEIGDTSPKGREPLLKVLSMEMKK